VGQGMGRRERGEEFVRTVIVAITQPHGKKSVMSGRLDHSTYIFSGLLSSNLGSVLSDCSSFVPNLKKKGRNSNESDL